MSIYIMKNGEKQQLIIPASDVQILDVDGNFKSNNLEDALKEVGGATEENVAKIEEEVKEVEEKVKEIEENITKVEENITKIEENITKVEENVREHTIQLKDLSNPNLLINGDFQVNQRKLNEYTENIQYTVDRWRLINGNRTTSVSEGKMVVHEDFIELTGAGKDQLYMHQPMEMNKQYLGKTMTLSCSIKLTDATQGSIFIQVSDYNINTIVKKIYSFSEIPSEEFTRISITFAVPTTLRNGLVAEIGTYDTYGNGMLNSKARLCINNVKLELGAVATPFIPRLYAEELSLCQRYYETGNNTFNGTVIDASSCRGNLPFKVDKRVTPSVILFNGSTTNCIVVNGNWVGSVTLFHIDKVGSCTISKSNGFTGLEGKYWTCMWTANAEIY